MEQENRRGGKEEMKKLILAAMLTAILLTGCDNGQAGTRVIGSVYPKIRQYGMDTDGYTYYYAVDERTGVVYLMFGGVYSSGITVALNTDGTPVTEEQLEAWGEDNELTD